MLCVGLDDGFNETKVVLPDGRYVSIPSRGRAGVPSTINIRGEDVGVASYETAEGAYTVGEAGEADSTKSDAYPVSALNRVIVSHALRVANVADDIFAVTGLPIRKFYRRAGLNEPLIREKCANLKRNDVRSSDSTPLARICEHEVRAEGIAAWLDCVSHASGDGGAEIDAQKAKDRIGVVDIGGRTTDIAVIRDWELDVSRSTTVEIGMFTLLEEITEGVTEEYDFSPTFEQIEQAKATGLLRMQGKEKDVSHIVAEAKRQVVKRIEAVVMQQFGNRASDIDQVLFVGGTSGYLASELKAWYPHAIIAQEPGFANARGMLRYAQLLQKG